MIRYLLDTNIFSYAARSSFPHFNRHFESIPLAYMAVSVITEAELLYGLARRPQAHVLAASVHRLLKKLTILPWDSEAAKSYAIVRADLETIGQPMSSLDTMIAAQALAENVILVTNDAAFRRIRGLKLEDWTQS